MLEIPLLLTNVRQQTNYAYIVDLEPVFTKLCASVSLGLLGFMKLESALYFTENCFDFSRCGHWGLISQDVDGEVLGILQFLSE